MLAMQTLKKGDMKEKEFSEINHWLSALALFDPCLMQPLVVRYFKNDWQQLNGSLWARPIHEKWH